MRFLLVLLILFGAAPAFAQHDDPALCTVTDDGVSTAQIADIPPAILKRLPGVGTADFIRAFSEGPRWVILYSQGKSWRARVLTLAKDGAAAVVSDIDGWRFPGGFCQAVDDGFSPPVKAP